MLLPNEEINNRSAGRCSGLFGKKQGNMTHIADNRIVRLHEAPQPLLSYPGATHDAAHYRARRLPLQFSACAVVRHLATQPFVAAIDRRWHSRGLLLRR